MNEGSVDAPVTGGLRSHEIRLICLNAWGGRLVEPLLAYLRAQRDAADVIALQEVFDGADPKSERHGVDRYAGTDLPVVLDLFPRCSAELRGFHAFLSEPYSSLGERLAVFTRADLAVGETGQSEIHSEIRQEAFGTPFRTHVIAQHVQLSVGKSRVRVINTHGLWIGGSKGDTPERIRQSESLRTLIEGFGEPTVLCGDLNLLPDTESIHILERGLRNLVVESRIPRTRSEMAPRSKGEFADYVFVTRDLMVSSFEAVDILVSDHLPLALRFRA